MNSIKQKHFAFFLFNIFLLNATIVVTNPQNVILCHIPDSIQEFYFIRHGQTDFNVGGVTKYPANMPLNQCGLQQAKELEPHVQALPIKSVCYSSLYRAEETKNIITAHLQLQETMLHDLRGMDYGFLDLSVLQSHDFEDFDSVIQEFVQRIAHGLEIALLQENPVLIVAHGETYKVICYLLDINYDDWIMDNCELIHFYKDCNNQWKTQKLYALTHPSSPY